MVSADDRSAPRLANRRLLSTLLAAALAVGLAACGSSESSSGDSSSTTYSLPADGATPIKLTVGQPSPSVGDVVFYWSLETGLFEKFGLDVSVVSQGSTQITNQAAGKLGVGAFGTAGMFPAVQSGRKMVAIFNETGGNTGAAITVRADAPYSSLMDLSGKSVGVVGATGQTYGAAAAYSADIVKNGGQALKIVVAPNVQSLTAGVQSGKFAAAVFNPVFAAAIRTGKLKQIVAASSDQAKSIAGSNIASASYLGLSSTLDENREALTRFVGAMRVGLSQVGAASVDEIGDALAKNASFAPSVIEHADLISELQEGALPFLPTQDGYIDEAIWQRSLAAFGGWGLNVGGVKIDLNADKFSYGQAVDMSYWNGATSLVDEYAQKYGLPSSSPSAMANASASASASASQ